MRRPRLPTLFLAALAVIAAAPAAAAAKPSTPELIQRDVDARKVDKDKANLYRAYALGSPKDLPRAYRSDTPWDGTLVLLELRRAVRTMKEGPTRSRIEGEIAPLSSSASCSSSGSTLPDTRETDHFFVAYDSATIGGGLDVDSYTTSLETAWTKEVDTFGWAAPPVAPTPAPGSKYHVRIDSLGSGLYGYVSSGGTYAGSVGNNPNTSWNEGDAFASCMVLNEDYSGFPSSPQDSLDSTTGHEFNHSIQYGYGALNGSNIPDDDFVEGGATWMEDEVHDGADDNYNFLWPAFNDSMGDYDASPYPYWLTFRGLTERYGTGIAGGGEQVMQDFWEETSKNTGNNLTAMQTAMANRGTSLAEAYHAYAIAAKYMKPCVGSYVLPYCFEEANGYVGAAGGTSVHKTISSVGGSTTGSTGVEDNYALNWVALPSSGGPYDVTVANTSSGGALRATIVCDTGSTLSLFPLPGGTLGAGETDTVSGFSPGASCINPRAVVTNETQTAANPSTSAARSYQVSTAAAASSDPTLTVARAGSGSGSVTSSPGGISCPSDCTQQYSPGTVVTLTATPASGSTFAGWSGGGCSGSGSCQVTVDASKSVTATFTAHPVLSVSVTGSGGVSSSPSGISCPGDCSQSYAPGTDVTLTATPDSGQTFHGWTGGGCSGTGTCTLTMGSNTSVNASFSSSSTDGGDSGAADRGDTGGGDSGGSGGTTSPPPSSTVTEPTTTLTAFDTVRPVVSTLGMSRTAFRAARSGSSIAVVGTRVRYVLSEPAITTFRVQRRTVGALVGGRCVRRTARYRDRRRCARYVYVRGSFRHTGRRGSNSFRFRGRIGGRTLRPGRYRLVGVARDAAGNRSAARRVRFRILR